jgi:hypothetical protein
MTYAFTYDVPIDEDFYRKIQVGLGPELPKGLITHIAMKLPQGGLRYIDVWETQEDSERFGEERLHPVVHPLLEKILGEAPPEPEHVPLNVIHVWGSGGTFSNPG